MKRTSTAAEKRHLARVAGLGCIVCSHCYGNEDTPAEVHHVHVSHGWGRTSHRMTMPLCATHHRGKGGVHDLGAEQFEAKHGYSELALLAVVHQILGVE